MTYSLGNINKNPHGELNYRMYGRHLAFKLAYFLEKLGVRTGLKQRSA